MLSYDVAEDDFFDAIGYIDTSVDFSPSEDNFIEIEEAEFNKYGYEIWARELISIEERRKTFLGEMGFHELIQCPNDCPIVLNLSEGEMSSERIIKGSSAELDSLSSPDDEDTRNFVGRTSDLNCRRSFVVHDIEQDGLPCVPNENVSDKLMRLQKVEMLTGLDCSDRNLIKRQYLSQGGKSSSCLEQKDRKLLRLWRSFKLGTEASKSFKHKSSITKSQLPRLMKKKIQKQSRRCKEVTALYAVQEIKAHKGLVRTMKFNPSGMYLASGGEDCNVLIWQIREVETCCSCFFEASAKLVSDVQGTKLWGNYSDHSAPILIPQRFIKIDETPMQALVGHTSDILDLSWSNSNMLLTSSKDKTVRMWKVGHDGCLKVFQHSDYVTCVQFNPINSRYFISGSIDGKVRIWGVTNSRVVDWVDIRDIVTSLCHCPDGKGFVVGSVSGNCSCYGYSVDDLQLNVKLSDRFRRKSSAKSVTGLQCFSEDSRRIVVTSADSRIQILDGTEAVLKLKGHKRVKSQSFASLSSDGKHVISVGDDCHVYIWNYDESNETSSKGAKSVHFCESFLAEGASVAVSWCGMNQEEEVLGGLNNLVSSSPVKMLKPSARPGHPHGGWLYSDILSRVSATWPEENLHSTTEIPLHAETSHIAHHPQHHRDYYPSVTSVSLTWSRPILTGGIDGTIKTFHYCGCLLGCK